MEKEPVLHLNPFTASTSETQLFAPPPSDTACHHKIYKFAMPEEMLDFDAAKVVKRVHADGRPGKAGSSTRTEHPFR